MEDKLFILMASIYTLCPIRTCSENPYRAKDATVLQVRASLLSCS